MLVSEIIEDARQIVGQCGIDVLLSRLTDAVVTLANKGNYDVLTGYADICTTTDGLYLSLPREIDTPLAINVGGYPKIFRNRWMEFHINGPGSFSKCPWNWDDRGDFPTVMDIINPSNLLAVADLKTDLDAQLLVVGTDENDQWIRSQNPDGTWRDGFLVPINLLSDFPSSIITPSLTRRFVRYFSVETITDLVSAVPHDFTTGASAIISTNVAPLPTPLVEGRTYFIRVVDSDSIDLYASGSNALTGTNPIKITSVSPSSSVNVRDERAVSVKTEFNSVTDHNISTGQAIQFTGSPLPEPISGTTTYYANVIDANNFTAHPTPQDAEDSINYVDVSSPGASVKVRALQEIAPLTFLNFGVDHNLIQGDAVTVSNTGGQLPTPLLAGVTYYVGVIDSNSINLYTTLADATTDTNPVNLITPGTGTNVVIKQIPSLAALGSSSNITANDHNLSPGDLVQFTTTGTFPAPIIQGTVYEHGNPSSANTFTLNTTAPAAVNITTLGTGQLFLIISRTFTVGFFNTWETDTTNLTTGTGVLLDTTGSFPFTTPALDTATTRYVRVDSVGVIQLFESSATASDSAIRATTNRSRTSNVAELTFGSPHGFLSGDVVDISGMGDTTYNATRATVLASGLTATAFRYNNTGSNEASTPDNSGQVIFSNIKVNALGAGTTFLVLERNVTAEVRSETLNISSLSYLQDGATVRLSTDGTLPAPLLIGTDYKIVLQTDGISIQTTGGVDIPITDIGDGAHTMYISRNFTVEIPTSFEVISNNYNDGDAVLYEAGAVAPAGLINGTTYYVRRISDDEIELYDTEAHAENTSSMVGRIVATSTGSGNQSLVQTLDNFFFKKVDRIDKSITDGFIQLYAWDTGRTDNITNLGRYAPDEILPSYRRIKIGSRCQWVRLRYKRRMFQLRSLEDFIPMTSRMALLMMLRALEYYRGELIDKAEIAENQAERFLIEEQKARSTPGGVSIQVNGHVFTNGDDYMN